MTGVTYAAQAPRRKRSLLKILVIVALVGVGLVGVAVVALLVIMPGKHSFSREISVAAPKERVHELVGDLKRWQEWGPWADEDPDMAVSYSESTNLAGSWHEWKGEKAGNGRLELIETDPEKGIRYRLTFEGWAPTEGGIRYDRTEGGTRVTWYWDVDVGINPMGRILMTLGRGTIEDMFDTGLHKIKRLAETN
jgi:carbon monoxide dehydrogenase subunit G